MKMEYDEFEDNGAEDKWRVPKLPSIATAV
jgi:hypothetical protein